MSAEHPLPTNNASKSGRSGRLTGAWMTGALAGRAAVVWGTLIGIARRADSSGRPIIWQDGRYGLSRAQVSFPCTLPRLTCNPPPPTIQPPPRRKFSTLHRRARHPWRTGRSEAAGVAALGDRRVRRWESG